MIESAMFEYAEQNPEALAWSAVEAAKAQKTTTGSK